LHLRQWDVAVQDQSFVIIGGGPAGLTAAYELVRHGHRPLVLERENFVGGIACTREYKGFRFDMGGHRFFTKSEEVNRMWHEVLLEEFLRRPRLSRIFYNNRFYNYPLKPLNAFRNLGPVESFLIFCSYARWHLFPSRVEETFEQWVTNRFGKRLFNTFFKTYTEKVWGIPCAELKAEWAAQRIKDLSLKTAVLSMFFKPKNTIKTLIEQFDYPRLGPGQLWDCVRRRIDDAGGEVRMNSDVTAIHRDGNRITAVTIQRDGTTQTIPGSHFVTSMPVTEFISKLDPPAPQPVRDAAARLKYRDFFTVCLMVRGTDLFPDNWIYIHDPTVKVGRIQNFGNWSPDMVPQPGMSSLGLEYFCNKGDEMWNTPDEQLIEQARQELARIGLARCEDVVDGVVYRVEKTYPVYDSDYAEVLGVVRQYMDALINCRTVGRNGLHRYNNQDHSMLTGMYAVRNLLHGEQHDLWAVNADQEYHEEVREPRIIESEEPALAEAMEVIFARLHRLGMGLAGGVVCAAAVFLLTLILVLKGGQTVGPNLALLGQYFPGYSVTFGGAALGAIYGFATGFVAGWFLAWMRNLVVFLYWVMVQRQVERRCLKHLLEYV
jgi:protoporphyrinogen oxidase